MQLLPSFSKTVVQMYLPAENYEHSSCSKSLIKTFFVSFLFYSFWCTYNGFTISFNLHFSIANMESLDMIIEAYQWLTQNEIIVITGVTTDVYKGF